MLKNPKTKSYQAVGKLGTKLRYGLTGTAMQVRSLPWLCTARLAA